MIIIKGVVEEGRKLGRKLGFPTANISLDPSLNIENGVYESWVEIDGNKAAPLVSISNVGNNPTVGETTRRVETHIIDQHIDLYGKMIVVTLGRRLRAEIKFNSLEELKAQIEVDLNSLKSKE